MTVKTIKSLDELTGLIEFAKADNHSLVFPTHAIMRDNIAIGTLSAIPTFLVWMHTKEAKARDSLELKHFLENFVSANGGRVMCVPCMQDSPYHKVLEHQDYVNLGKYSLFVKGL